MAMGTGAKIAIGCGCVVLLAGTAVVGVVGWGAYWAKGKLGEAAGGLEKMAEKTQEIERWQKKADENPFTAPADGLIQEARLRSFLDVRKEVFAVYQRHKAEFDSLGARTKGKQQLNLSETLEAGSQLASLFGDVRLTQAKALAGHGMSQEEYRYLQMAVYKSAWAAEASKDSGKLPSEQMTEAAKQMEEATGKALAEAKKQGVPGSAGLSEEDQRKLQESMGAGLGAAAKAVEVPRANVELFRKYETEIRKYAMSGLEVLSL